MVFLVILVGFGKDVIGGCLNGTRQNPFGIKMVMDVGTVRVCVVVGDQEIVVVGFHRERDDDD